MATSLYTLSSDTFLDLSALLVVTKNQAKSMVWYHRRRARGGWKKIREIAGLTQLSREQWIK